MISPILVQAGAITIVLLVVVAACLPRPASKTWLVPRAIVVASVGALIFIVAVIGLVYAQFLAANR